MKYSIQLEALEGPLNEFRIIVFRLDEVHYQAAQEFVKLHDRSPWIHDIAGYDDSSGKEFSFIEESEYINIKILDENSLIVSEFKLHELNQIETLAENGRPFPPTHNVKYFWEKYGDNKPCLIYKVYQCGDVNEDLVLWEHEIEEEDTPKKKDFEFKTAFVEVRDINHNFLLDDYWNCLEANKSIFYKKNPMKATCTAVEEEFNPELLDCFLLDSNGKIIKESREDY